LMGFIWFSPSGLGFSSSLGCFNCIQGWRITPFALWGWD
jgi:hypothetical protein